MFRAALFFMVNLLCPRIAPTSRHLSSSPRKTWDEAVIKLARRPVHVTLDSTEVMREIEIICRQKIIQAKRMLRVRVVNVHHLRNSVAQADVHCRCTIHDLGDDLNVFLATHMIVLSARVSCPRAGHRVKWLQGVMPARSRSRNRRRQSRQSPCGRGARRARRW